jgi:hypothetical protein
VGANVYGGGAQHLLPGANALQPSEGVTWLLQMSREMSLEMQMWDLFASTWKAMGFAFDENMRRRTRTHGRMLSGFYEDVRQQLVPKGNAISGGDLKRWTAKFDRLQRTHGQLLPALRRERDRFMKEFKAGAPDLD